MDTTTEERRGASAEQWLNNEVHKDAYTRIEKTLVDMICQLESPEKVYQLACQLSAARKVRTYAAQVAYSGKMAAMETERKRGLMERMRSAFPA